MRLVRLPGVFQPPSDAWVMVERLRQERPPGSVLDVCSGSGVLAIAAALRGARHVTAVDISRRSVAAIRLNSWLNGVQVEALRGNLFEPVENRRFDLIVSNPPYLPVDVSALPSGGLSRAWEGGRSGRAFIDRIAAGAADHLTPEGTLLLTCSSVCGERETMSAISAGGLEPEVVIRRRGPLGPLLAARADWLREQGLLLDRDEEEILVIQARVATRAGPASPSRALRRSTSSPNPSPGPSAPARGAAS